MNLPDRARDIVANYPGWSHAERRILPSIQDDVIRYLADGEGNAFIAEFCARVVMPALAGADRTDVYAHCDDCGAPVVMQRDIAGFMIAVDVSGEWHNCPNQVAL